MVLETLVKLYLTKSIFFPQNGENRPKISQKLGFFLIYWKMWSSLFFFFWIFSIMKGYIICCDPAQISFLGKFSSWDRPKSSQPIRLQILKWTLTPEKSDVTALAFFNVDTNSWKKFIEKCSGGHGQKWLWPFWSRDSQIACISRMNGWNKPVFYMLIQIEHS